MAWPSLQLYNRGLALMRTVHWNESDGFDHIGQPRTLHRTRPQLHWRMGQTRMLRSNTWQFSMGDCDQAFLFYVLYLTSSVGADFEPVGSGVAVSIGSMHHGKDLPSFVHTARHYYSHPKPWYWSKCQQNSHRDFMPGRYARCPVIPRSRGLYLKNAGRVLWFLNHTDWRSRPASSTCARAFSQVLPELTKYGQRRTYLCSSSRHAGGAQLMHRAPPLAHASRFDSTLFGPACGLKRFSIAFPCSGARCR